MGISNAASLSIGEQGRASGSSCLRLGVVASCKTKLTIAPPLAKGTSVLLAERTPALTDQGCAPSRDFSALCLQAIRKDRTRMPELVIRHPQPTTPLVYTKTPTTVAGSSLRPSYLLTIQLLRGRGLVQELAFRLLLHLGRMGAGIQSLFVRSVD